MKRNQIKTRWGWVLGLALFAVAIPSAVQAQAVVKTAQINAPSAQKVETTKEAAENKEISLELRGKICSGEFIFEGNTIRFSKGDPVPEDVSVDGKHWDDLSKPFELGYTPDFAKAGILQRDARPPRAYYVNVSEKMFSLRIDEDNKSPDPFYVKLAMKNQISHDILPWYRVSPKDSIGRANISLLYKVEAANNASLWNDCIRERKIILNAIIQGQGTFVFEGNKIQYQHEAGKQPDMVKINGRRWTYLSEPFELPFQIDTAHPEMVKTKGENPVKLSIINDQRFEVYFNDPRSPSATHSTGYSITITPGK